MVCSSVDGKVLVSGRDGEGTIGTGAFLSSVIRSSSFRVAASLANDEADTVSAKRKTPGYGMIGKPLNEDSKLAGTHLVLSIFA